MSVAVALGAGLIISLIGCASTDYLCDPDLFPGKTKDPFWIENCSQYYQDAGSDAPSDAASDASADAPSDASDDAPIPGACPGQCVPGPPSAWDLPALVWMGSAAKAPPCPFMGPQLAYEGHADLVAPSVCGECRCGQPEGSCSLPATLTARAATCTATTSGTSSTPFDPPGAWDGSCTGNEAIPTGAQCQEGPCVQSLTMAPLGLDEAGCAPIQLAGPVDTAPSWDSFVRVCRGFPVGGCENWGDVCTVPKQDGFRHCIFRNGDVPCPSTGDGPYQERHVFYAGFKDTRSCSPCTCGPPTDGACSALLSFYTGDACSVPLAAATVTSSAPICLDLPAGAGLATKSAGAPLYHPGACEPGGGVPAGAAKPTVPTTLCCNPSP